MGLRRRSERLLDADVQLAAAEREPAASAHGEQRRLLDLGQSEQLAVERAGRVLAARRRRDLDVVESGDARHRDARPSYSGFGFRADDDERQPVGARHDEPRDVRRRRAGSHRPRPRLRHRRRERAGALEDDVDLLVARVDLVVLGPLDAGGSRISLIPNAVVVPSARRILKNDAAERLDRRIVAVDQRVSHGRHRIRDAAAHDPSRCAAPDGRLRRISAPPCR